MSPFRVLDRCLGGIRGSERIRPGGARVPGECRDATSAVASNAVPTSGAAREVGPQLVACCSDGQAAKRPIEWSRLCGRSATRACSHVDQEPAVVAQARSVFGRALPDLEAARAFVGCRAHAHVVDGRVGQGHRVKARQDIVDGLCTPALTSGLRYRLRRSRAHLRIGRARRVRRSPGCAALRRAGGVELP